VDNLIFLPRKKKKTFVTKDDLKDIVAVQGKKKEKKNQVHAINLRGHLT
jgi:hypothetical protein